MPTQDSKRAYSGEIVTTEIVIIGGGGGLAAAVAKVLSQAFTLLGMIQEDGYRIPIVMSLRDCTCLCH